MSTLAMEPKRLINKASLLEQVHQINAQEQANATCYWELLKLAYALGVHELLVPFSKLLRCCEGAEDADIPRGLLRELKKEELLEELRAFGLSQRVVHGDNLLQARISAITFAEAVEGKIDCLIECPACRQHLLLNAVDRSLLRNKIVCVSCFTSLDFSLNHLQEELKENVITYAAHLKYAKNLDARQVATLASVALLLRGLVDIYFVRLRVERVGHLLLNTSLFLSDLQAKGKLEPSVVFAFPNEPENIANGYLLRFWEQLLHYGAWIPAVYQFCLSNDPFKGLAVDLESPVAHIAYDINGLLCSQSLPLRFSPAEHARGQKALEEMGIGIGEKFVCILGRDDRYLDEKLPCGPSGWRYSDYRNVTIEKYIPAMKHLAENGISALRMGYLVKNPLSVNDPKIIDYASFFRSPFLDIFIASNCYFFVSCMTGLDIMPLIMGSPLLLVNVPQYTSKHFFSDDRVVVMFKKIFCKKKQRYLSFEEAICSGHGYINMTEHLAEHDIVLEENSPEELKAAFEEMLERCNGTWVVTEEEIHLQCLFKAILQKHSSFERMIKAHVSMAFLQMNPYFLPVA